MTATADNLNMALFCDFENVALGVRDAKYEKFDIKLVLERLLLKGSIVVKKAYCDWERYKSFKATMHEANFELIEIPHLRQSGKNSADIRLVVDALDLCYTKSHVDTFVIISGDSDFSPLVSKLRENAKQVIGVGVKQSTSDLLISNCDEFIFYDDLVRDSQRAARPASRSGQVAGRRSGDEGGADEDKQNAEEAERRRTEAIALALVTYDDLVSERGDGGKIWASMLKQAIKRRRPHFNESYYGFRAFGNLLEEAQARGLLVLGRDEKSGTFIQRAAGGGNAQEAAAAEPERVESRPVANGNRREGSRPGSAKAAAGSDESGFSGAREVAPARDARADGSGSGASPQPAEAVVEAAPVAAASGRRSSKAAAHAEKGVTPPPPAEDSAADQAEAGAEAESAEELAPAKPAAGRKTATRTAAAKTATTKAAAGKTTTAKAATAKSAVTKKSTSRASTAQKASAQAEDQDAAAAEPQATPPVAAKPTRARTAAASKSAATKSRSTAAAPAKARRSKADSSENAPVEAAEASAAAGDPADRSAQS